MTAGEIRELDPQTVERIAAGEVVERPASAVKELVENSLDADASRVTVAVEDGGTECIRVSDNGVGMDEETLRQAVEKHTTSKISDIEDLEGGVGTLGFRGEALHAIGAVSRLTITSRPRGGDRATALTVEGGEITNVSPAGHPEGTTVEVRDLFYNVPARRKYLKTETTEFAHVNTVVTNYALANPEIAVTLEHNDSETFATTGTGDRRETVLSVYGREVAESMIPVESHVGDGPVTDISGLVSHPETNRSNRQYLSTFVNGRYVTADTVREAITAAYGDQLAPDRYPFAVIFLSVDPATVDVNVHPRKLEVRFEDAEAVRRQVTETVEEALLDEGLIRTVAPRGRSAAAETDVHPGTAENHETDSASAGVSAESAEVQSTEATGNDGEGSSTQTTTTPRPTGTASDSGEGQGGRPDEQGSKSATGADTPDQMDATRRTDVSSHAQPSTSRPSKPAQDTAESAAAAETDEGSPTDASRRSRDPADTDSPSTRSRASSEPTNVSSEERRHLTDAQKFRGGGRQERLGDADPETTFDQLPAMRILGQFQDTYVVAETRDGLVLVDQHAADERINFERLRTEVADGTTTQALAEPVRLELTAHEAELYEGHSAALDRLGFHGSLVDDRVLEVTTVPALVAESAGPELVRDVLGEFVEGEIAAEATVDAVVDRLLADLACYPSITGNTSLTDGSVIDLLETLDDCDNPWACPHGRPVVVEFDTGEIAARFERDYPGHS